MLTIYYEEATMAKERKILSARDEKFCQLWAGGTHTKTSAYIAAGYSPNGARQAAFKKLKVKLIKQRVKQLRKQHAAAAGVDAEWVRKELVDLHKDAKLVGDVAASKGVLDVLNRMNGYYEKDNKQKNEISLQMQF